MTETDSEQSEDTEWSVMEKKIARMDREELLQVAGDLVNFLYRRTCAERFREQETDKARTAYARVLVAAIQAYGGILKDGELDDMKRRLDALEAAKRGGNGE